MSSRDSFANAESPFQLEALEPFQESPQTEGLTRVAAAASHRLSRGARRHLRRALLHHLMEAGASESEAFETIEAESPFLDESGEGPGPLEESEVKPLKQPAGLKGQFFRLDTKTGGQASKGTSVAVYVPVAAMKTAPLNVIVWMHGLSRDKDGVTICGSADNVFLHLADERFPLMKIVEDSGRPFILVAPSMSWSGGSHTLEKPAAMNVFLGEVETALEDVRKWLKANGMNGWSDNAKIGKLILAGHSKAYVVLNGLAARVEELESSSGALGKLSEVWSLDTMYGGNGGPAAMWAVWMVIKKKAGVRLHVLYFRNTDTSTEAEWLERKLKGLGITDAVVEGFDKKPKIAAIPARGGRPAVPGQNAENHCTLTRDHFGRLLAAAK